jgi:hypothetical protein
MRQERPNLRDFDIWRRLDITIASIGLRLMPVI